MTRKDERSKRGLLFVLLAVAALLVVGAAAGAYFALSDDTSASESIQQAMREAGCTYQTFPALPAGVHISDPNAIPKEWNSVPPTSGPHFGQWVIWGAYDQPVRLAEAVHNLEHGGIVIYYGEDVPAEEVEKLRGFWREDPVAMLLAPLPRLATEIAMTAWYTPNPGEENGNGILAKCARFDQGAFEAFRDAYRFKGPERIPPESLQPGS
jgi:Protein of unknown function (DUF3105)